MYPYPPNYPKKSLKRNHIVGQVIMVIATLGFLVAAILISSEDEQKNLIVHEGKVEEIDWKDISTGSRFGGYKRVLCLKMVGLNDVFALSEYNTDDYTHYVNNIHPGDNLKIQYATSPQSTSGLNYRLYQIEKQDQVILSFEDSAESITGLIIFMYGIAGFCFLLSAYLYWDYKRKFSTQS